ncbi:MAG: BlaI/MecI/CopY family transcriptional regulator [Gammaproteobacteria bacterium]|nr:BlaI/MecI/CopY family transcriptional regulator [Gammaproteobacteria bacterium]NNC97012.1 BlaI/MecI/CopY family transcriptional regulator [Gammaproteobacteria bacterium]NNM14371.1 BlaI/MecI/CopY family transcriptional regulator [Gammaproteobacteria bacterium]
MARKASKTLTDGELRIMEVMWELESASVRQVATRLREKDEVAYNTVQTMMGILESKGYLDHHKEGRAFVYTPIINRRTARSSALKQLMNSFFDGSPQALVQNLIQDENIDAIEVESLLMKLTNKAD